MRSPRDRVAEDIGAGPIAVVVSPRGVEARSADGVRSVELSGLRARWAVVDGHADVVWVNVEKPGAGEALAVIDLAAAAGAFAEATPVDGEPHAWWVADGYVDIGNLWVSYPGKRSLSQTHDAMCNTFLDLAVAPPEARAAWGSADCEAGGETMAEQTARVRTMNLHAPALAVLRARAEAAAAPATTPLPPPTCEKLSRDVSCKGKDRVGDVGTVQALGSTGYTSVITEVTQGDVGIYTTYDLRKDGARVDPGKIDDTCVSADGTAVAVRSGGATTLLTRSSSVALPADVSFAGWFDGVCVR